MRAINIDTEFEIILNYQNSEIYDGITICTHYHIILKSIKSSDRVYISLHLHQLHIGYCLPSWMFDIQFHSILMYVIISKSTFPNN